MTDKEKKGRCVRGWIDDYVCLDLETTGLSADFNEIIEIGAVRVRGGEPVAEFSTLVKPDEWIPEVITDITGISNGMVEKAPSVNQVLPALLDFIGSDPILGHNVSFDLAFLRKNCRRWLDAELENDWLDTMRISRKLLPYEPHHRLCDLERIFRLHNEHAHRALSDALLTHECYRKLKEYAELLGSSARG